MLWGVLARGETSLQLETDVPREFVIILQGILIMSVVVTYQLAKRRLFARQLRRAAEVEDFEDSGAAADIDGAREGGSLMDLGDLGRRDRASRFTYFTIIYVTGLGGLYSERSGIVNIGLEGMMIIGTVTGSWGTSTSPPSLGWGLPWGPLMGLLIGLIAGALFASIHAARHGDVQGRPDRLRRRDQPGGDRARAVPVHGCSSARRPSRTRVSRT